MTTFHLKSFVGCRMSEEERCRVNHPYFELHSHVTMKMVQSGAVLGAGLIGPIVAYSKGNRDCASIEQSAYKYGRGGMIAGLLLGPVLTGCRTRSLTGSAVFDKSYQLRFNRKQIVVDRLSIVGAVVGAGVASHLGKELGMGVVFGFAGGCLGGGLLNTLVHWGEIAFT